MVKTYQKYLQNILEVSSKKEAKLDKQCILGLR